jgi:DNA polymerase II small subunit/DNA polymerase delta subunit B
MKAEELLRQKGVTTRELEQMLRARAPTIRVNQPRTRKAFKLGIIADTHLVDKGCALSELAEFYRRCKAEGVKEIVHAGDLVHGMGVYRGQLNDLLCFGFDDHLAFCVRYYPKVEGITTYFIGGNHCESYTIQAGVEFGKALADKRPDMAYLGMYDATAVLNGVKIELHHGARSIPYAVSYHLQKYVEKLAAGNKPQLYVLGHYHTALYIFYRNVHCFLPGCFQRPNNFSVRMGFPNLICGWIVELEVADDRHRSIKALKSELVAFY